MINKFERTKKFKKRERSPLRVAVRVWVSVSYFLRRVLSSFIYRIYFKKVRSTFDGNRSTNNQHPYLYIENKKDHC